MARYRKIDPRIWNDEKFAALSHEAQRMFFFVLTHPSMTALGAFRISRAGMAEELGLEGKEFLEPFTELFSKGLVKYDERAFLLFAPNFLKYNPPENPNVVKGWAAAVDLLPECPLKREVILRAKSCAACTSACSKAFEQAFGSLLKGFAEHFPKGMPKQEQEQEQEQEKNIYAPDGASVSEDQKTERPSPIKKPADVSKEDWANYLKLRKQKRLPLTALALQEMEHEAEKAGKSMAEVVRICLKNSWAGFKASWLTKPQHGSQQPVMQQTSFADLDYSEGINPDGTF